MIFQTDSILIPGTDRPDNGVPAADGTAAAAELFGMARGEVAGWA